MTARELARVEREIRRRVEHFLETSGGALNDGGRIGVDYDGEFDDDCAACLLGAVILGAREADDYREDGARLIGITVRDANHVERGYAGWQWPGDGTDPALYAIGQRIRRDYYEVSP